MMLFGSRHFIATVLAPVLLFAAAIPSAQAQGAPPIRVGTVKMALQPINPAKTFVGRIEARERVDIRARVTGFLEEVLFKDGQVVKEGDLLYRIEKPPFESALSRAKGALDQARGQAAFADEQLARATELMKTQTVSAAAHDQRLAEQLTAQGNVKIAEANVQNAEIELGYTEISRRFPA
jgi:membrane fusion protein (multidrug efflux system)